MHAPEPPWVAQRAAEARRLTYQVAVNRPWWIMLIAGLTAIGVYLYEVLGLAVTQLDGEPFFNPRFGGLVVATMVACVALTFSIRGKWPALAGLTAIAPLWLALVREPSFAAWTRTTTDLVFILAVALQPLTAIVTLALPRPGPPPDESGGGLPDARLRRRI